jgi:hypothetical protein
VKHVRARSSKAVRWPAGEKLIFAIEQRAPMANHKLSQQNRDGSVDDDGEEELYVEDEGDDERDAYEDEGKGPFSSPSDLRHSLSTESRYAPGIYFFTIFNVVIDCDSSFAKLQTMCDSNDASTDCHRIIINIIIMSLFRHE